VSRDHLAILVNQDWYVKAEGLDAAGDLANLVAVVDPRIAGIKLSSVIGRLTTAMRRSSLPPPSIWRLFFLVSAINRPPEN
jgi:hypothetical protein